MAGWQGLGLPEHHAGLFVWQPFHRHCRLSRQQTPLPVCHGNSGAKTDAASRHLKTFHVQPLKTYAEIVSLSSLSVIKGYIKYSLTADCNCSTSKSCKNMHICKSVKMSKICWRLGDKIATVGHNVRLRPWLPYHFHSRSEHPVSLTSDRHISL